MPLVGAYNFRDLGGYPTTDGGETRWKQLYRSDTLHELTQSDLVALRAIGLRSVIDLRTAAEVERTGRGPLRDEPVGYRHLSVIQEGISTDPVALPPLAELDLAFLYLRWLDSSPGAFVEALAALGDPDSYPVVFHCAAGKDRTGVLAALVLDIVGVQPTVIVDDYALTAMHLDPILVRQRSDPETAQRMIDAPQLFGAESHTMENFLDGLYQRYGGARGWAMSCGLTSDDLDRLTSILIEPKK